MEDLKKTVEINDEQEHKPGFGIKTDMYWWLNFRRAFFIGDEYKIELEAIDRKSNSVKIVVTNLKNPNHKPSRSDRLIKWDPPADDDEQSLNKLLAPFAGE